MELFSILESLERMFVRAGVVDRDEVRRGKRNAANAFRDILEPPH